MKYNMEEFLVSSMDSYEALAGGTVQYDTVTTPFLDETNDYDPCTNPTSITDGRKCPCCRGIYDKALFTEVKAGRANARPKKRTSTPN